MEKEFRIELNMLITEAVIITNISSNGIVILPSFILFSRMKTAVTNVLIINVEIIVTNDLLTEMFL